MKKDQMKNVNLDNSKNNFFKKTSLGRKEIKNLTVEINEN